jgi:EAL domain-containing protein (putative c-di-GMP-specific phosphodiesterase class I)
VPGDPARQQFDWLVAIDGAEINARPDPGRETGRLVVPVTAPSTGLITEDRRRAWTTGGIRVLIHGLADLARRSPATAVFAVGVVVVAASSALELLNPGNCWLLFEDVSCAVAPLAGALAVLIAARRGDAEHRLVRRSLALALGLSGLGMLLADIPDLTHLSLGPIAALPDGLYVMAAVIAMSTLARALYQRLDPDARLAAILDGLVIMAASMTLVTANWVFQTVGQNGMAPGGSIGPGQSLIGPLISTTFFASAAVAAVTALALRVAPAPRSIWLVVPGVILLAIAWEGWIGRMIAGVPDGIEPMDFIFPAGALMSAWGGLTWSLESGGGVRWERLARRTSDWLPIVAIVSSAVLDLMPRAQTLVVDPIAVNTCIVVLLAMARQRILQARERAAASQLRSERNERAAATVSLARLEPSATVEVTADRICSEALHIDGVDTVVLFVFSPDGVVPIARSGQQCRPVAICEPVPEAYGRELIEHAAFGLWLESWTGRAPRDDFDRATMASGLKADALAPLIWNDEPIGVLSMGTISFEHARLLSDRLATLTEFSVMSAAVLGPMLSERWRRDLARVEIQCVIDTGAFTPVFQPIVDLATREYVGYEALTRFDNGTRPDLRFMEADKVGMMVQLETACLHRQVEQARRLPQGSFLSLNVSPALAICLTPMLDVLGAADRAVVLEVTEHVEIDDYPKLMAALNQVRPHAMLAVDDAGAGYAGLRHILELKPEFVKLDISLVRNIDSDPARQAMVAGMARFAESVGCALIGEGIETENELTALRLLHVEFGQGYFLARPATIEAIVEAQSSPLPMADKPAKPRRRSRAA